MIDNNSVAYSIKSMTVEILLYSHYLLLHDLNHAGDCLIKRIYLFRHVRCNL